MKKVVITALLSMGLLSGVASANIASDLSNGLDVTTIINNAKSEGLSAEESMTRALTLAPQLAEEIITAAIKSTESTEEQVLLYVVAQELGVNQETAFTSAVLANVDPSILSEATATGRRHGRNSPRSGHYSGGHFGGGHFGGGCGGGGDTASPN